MTPFWHWKFSKMSVSFSNFLPQNKISLERKPMEHYIPNWICSYVDMVLTITEVDCGNRRTWRTWDDLDRDNIY